MKDRIEKIEKILNERYPSAPTYNYAIAHEIEDLFLNDNACINIRKQITKRMIEEYREWLVVYYAKSVPPEYKRVIDELLRWIDRRE